MKPSNKKFKPALLRGKRRYLIILHDSVMLVVAWLGAYWLRFNLGDIPQTVLPNMLISLVILAPIQMIAYAKFGLYRGVWRFASIPDLMRILKAVAWGTLVTVLVLFVVTRLEDLPRSVPVIYMGLLVLLLSGSRFAYRWYRDHAKADLTQKRVLIIGAGNSGETLVRDLLMERRKEYRPVAFIDDNAEKIGKELHGIRVVGNTRSLVQQVSAYRIDIIMLAIPNASPKKMRRIVRLCGKTGVAFRTLPKLKDLVSGHSVLQELREVRIEDLLGRESIDLDKSGLTRSLQSKVVLVTGAGGSIGSELCRQIASYRPELLVLVDNSEFNLYKIARTLAETWPSQPIVASLTDITDQVAVTHVLAKYKPTALFHAAAYKHVPLLEDQMRQAVRNNIVGTQTIAEAAMGAGVEVFVQVSTDKAVNPTNVMGLTKRVAEIFCQNVNRTQAFPTRFITVRFGNVLDSAGSVVPLFRRQIQQGGPVTLTSSEITRFFMTIAEASQLILQASSLGRGNEIFVLEMGSPIKIEELARNMIVLAGKTPDVDIKIQYVGLRPGEKMHEELFYAHETIESTSNNKIRLVLSSIIAWPSFKEQIDQLLQCVEEYDETRMAAILFTLVPEYELELQRQKNVLHFPVAIGTGSL